MGTVRDISMTGTDMARVLLLPLFFCIFTISSINCAPQFFGRLKPFYSFQSFRVLSQDERDSENVINVNSKAPKASSASLKIEPVPTPTATTTTTPSSPSSPPTTSTIIQTTEVVVTTTVDDFNETEADSLKDLQDVDDETLEKLVVLDPIAVGETISVNDEPQHDTMNIVDFDSESLL